MTENKLFDEVLTETGDEQQLIESAIDTLNNDTNETKVDIIPLTETLIKETEKNEHLAFKIAVGVICGLTAAAGAFFGIRKLKEKREAEEASEEIVATELEEIVAEKEVTK